MEIWLPECNGCSAHSKEMENEIMEKYFADEVDKVKKIKMYYVNITR